MKRLLAASWFVQLGILSTGIDCSPTSPEASPRASMDEPFALGVGESTVVEGVDLSLTFLEVARDSRCPSDATCIVAGEAIVVFEAQSNDTRTELTFEVPPGGSDRQEFGDFVIGIIDLEPATKAGERIDPSSYVAQVEVASPD